MRCTPEDRRKGMLEVAKEVFREVGYERASMATISSRIGGSKSTLYSYFESKEDLFAAAMIDAIDQQGQKVIDLLDPEDPDIAQRLLLFGTAYLDLITSPDAISIIRTAIAEGNITKQGIHFYAHGPQRAWAEVASYLGHMMEKRALRAAPPALVAAHLKALLVAGMVEPLLYGAQPQFDTKEAVAAAIDTFLHAYAHEAGHGRACTPADCG